MIHPYDNPDIIAGQGTIALELLSQVENLDAIVVPIGGGGMVLLHLSSIFMSFRFLVSVLRPKD